MIFLKYFAVFCYFCTQKRMLMTEVSKKYRLNSMEEPTDEMLQELMEDVAKAARKSGAKVREEQYAYWGQ